MPRVSRDSLKAVPKPLSPPTPQQLEPGASEGSRNKRVSLENLGLGQVDRVVQVCRLDPRVSGGKATGLQ